MVSSLSDTEAGKVAEAETAARSARNYGAMRPRPVTVIRGESSRRFYDEVCHLSGEI